MDRADASTTEKMVPLVIGPNLREPNLYGPIIAKYVPMNDVNEDIASDVRNETMILLCIC